ncbi:MAG: transposase [Betaproteobacteria bacterium]|nr:transposase [Betaproteobacteria bacterium]
MSESIMQSSVDLVDPALVVGRRSNGRNIYSKAAKQRLVEVCLKPGVSLARVALHNGLNANVLRRWVTLHLRKPGAMPVPSASFIPVAPLPGRNPAAPIEIDVGGATLRLQGPVDAEQLRLVLHCLRHP